MSSAVDNFLSNWGSQARKGILELMTMSALAQTERYGYELVERLSAQSDTEVSDGTLYAILTRLKAEGLVQTRWETPPKGPARKYYSLTANGHSALAGMKASWERLARGVAAMIVEDKP